MCTHISLIIFGFHMCRLLCQCRGRPCSEIRRAPLSSSVLEVLPIPAPIIITINIQATSPTKPPTSQTQCLQDVIKSSSFGSLQPARIESSSFRGLQPARIRVKVN